MFEDHFKSLFGVAIDGVVYGNGSKVSNKAGALVEYVRFMGNPNVTFLYWGILIVKVLISSDEQEM